MSFQQVPLEPKSIAYLPLSTLALIYTCVLDEFLLHLKDSYVQMSFVTCSFISGTFFSVLHWIFFCKSFWDCEKMNCFFRSVRSPAGTIRPVFSSLRQMGLRTSSWLCENDWAREGENEEDWDKACKYLRQEKYKYICSSHIFRMLGSSTGRSCGRFWINSFGSLQPLAATRVSKALRKINFRMEVRWKWWWTELLDTCGSVEHDRRRFDLVETVNNSRLETQICQGDLSQCILIYVCLWLHLYTATA